MKFIFKLHNEFGGLIFVGFCFFILSLFVFTTDSSGWGTDLRLIPFALTVGGIIWIFCFIVDLLCCVKIEFR